MSNTEGDTAETWMRDDLARVSMLFGHTEATAEWVADTFTPLAGRILARRVQDAIQHSEARAA